MQQRKKIGRLAPILGTAGLLAMAVPASAATDATDPLHQRAANGATDDIAIAANDCLPGPNNYWCGKGPAWGSIS